MFGKYAAFIIPAYLVTFAVIAGLVISIVMLHRRRRRELAELEAKGLRRRS